MVPLILLPLIVARHAVNERVAPTTGPDPDRLTTLSLPTFPVTGRTNPPIVRFPARFEPVCCGVNTNPPPPPRLVQKPALSAAPLSTQLDTA